MATTIQNKVAESKDSGKKTLQTYVKSMEGFEDLMQDDYKRNQLREKLAHELYRQFRSEYYPELEERVLEAAEEDV